MQSKEIFRTCLFVVFFLSLFVGFLAHASSKDREPEDISFSDLTISGINIEFSDLSEDKTEWIKMARDLIFLKEGDPFSATKLQESLDALKLSERFREINVDSTEEEGNRIKLLFSLTPFRLIKDIKFDGEFPLFEREILNTMTIYTGDAFIEEELQKQASLIEEFFQREGFPVPIVNVTAGEDPDDGFFVIQVDIEKGPYFTLEQLIITGNRSFSSTKLKLKMHTWRVLLVPGSARRFIEEDLKKDIKHLTEYYWKKKYPDVHIHFKTEKDSQAKSVTVLLNIDEGPRYDIVFVGNEEFWDRTLRKDLILFEKGNKNDLGLKRSVRKIKERYRVDGYLNTSVEIEEETKTGKHETIRALRFVIDEGPCSIVNSIEIAGNRAFDYEKLQKQMLIRLPGFLEKGAFVPETFEQDINAVKSLYIREGYMDINVREGLTWSEDKSRVSVNLEIEEGPQTIVSSVERTGITVVSEEEAHEAIHPKKGKPFRKYMIRSDENALSALISEKGRPHVKVKGDVSISRDRSKADVVYTVDEGQYVVMGHVYFKGNLRTKDKILQNELEIEAGYPFSLVDMIKGQRNIRNLDIFNSVQFKTIGLKEKEEEINLFVEIEEKKPFFVEAGGGYETKKGLFVHARAGDHNMFGAHKDGWLEGEVSQIGYRGALGIREPRILGSRISAALGLFSERREEFNQDFGTVTYGSSLSFTRKWFQRLTTGLSFRFEERDQFSRGLSEEKRYLPDHGPDEFKSRTIFVTSPSISYDTRDSFVRPKRGTLSSFSMDISNGLSNPLDDFLRYRIDLRLYVSPLSRLTFAFLGRAGHIDPFGETESVPDDQLFFLGGTSDVRGFDENLLRFDTNKDPVGGSTSVAGSVEARIDLGKNFELTTFYDTGRVTDTSDEIGSDQLRSSVGGGLRYITPIGAIGFLYGIKLDRKEGESPGRLHFSLGYTF